MSLRITDYETSFYENKESCFTPLCKIISSVSLFSISCFGIIAGVILIYSFSLAPWHIVLLSGSSLGFVSGIALTIISAKEYKKEKKMSYHWNDIRASDRHFNMSNDYYNASHTSYKAISGLKNPSFGTSNSGSKKEKMDDTKEKTQKLLYYYPWSLEEKPREMSIERVMEKLRELETYPDHIYNQHKTQANYASDRVLRETLHGYWLDKKLRILRNEYSEPDHLNKTC